MYYPPYRPPQPGYYGYPQQARDMYIYDGSLVFDEPGDEDDLKKQLKKIQNKLESIDKKLKTIQQQCRYY